MTRTKKLSTGQKITLWLFVVCLLVPGALGFVDKFAMFVRLLYLNKGSGFTLMPVATYLCVAAGLLCLFVWAVAHGMFRDIEGPKYDHIERERKLDHEDGIEWE